jgi:lipoprotein-anchoring transpeptidase ErfK/SrfK
MPHKIFTHNRRKSPWPRRIALVALLAAAGLGAYKYLMPLRPALTEAVNPVTETTPAPAAPAANPAQAPATSAPTPGTTVEQARARLASGDSAGAKGMLAPILDGKAEAQLLPQALVLAADIESAQGNKDQALTLLERAVKDAGAGADAPLANARYAMALEATGKLPEAEAIFTRIRDTAPKGMRAAALAGLGRKAERADDLLGARTLYQQALADALPGTAEWEEALDLVGRMNTQIIFSPMETPESKYYAIEKGDNLNGIGVKFNTTQGLLIRANNLSDAARLSLGQRLKITPKDFRIVVERSTCKIYLLDSEGIFKRYRTGLGMPGHETALGKYTIGNKEKDPTWHPAGRPPVPPLDPANELGTRWMPLVPAESNLPNDLGIHGTIAPETIGQYKSHGCPRMLKDDVEELWDLVVRSTPVQIVDVIDWNEILKPSAPAPAQTAGGPGHAGRQAAVDNRVGRSS